MSETLERVLRLLGLLQSRPVWTGTELAAELSVTTRSVRRDVERLRGLGYPIRATQGVGGGYQLGAGRELPPLLLDDGEAVAVAGSLRVAAGGSIAGVGEPALRALSKLDQMLPARLRGSVDAVAGATVSLDGTRGGEGAGSHRPDAGVGPRDPHPRAGHFRLLEGGRRSAGRGTTGGTIPSGVGRTTLVSHGLRPGPR